MQDLLGPYFHAKWPKTQIMHVSISLSIYFRSSSSILTSFWPSVIPFSFLEFLLCFYSIESNILSFPIDFDTSLYVTGVSTKSKCYDVNNYYVARLVASSISPRVGQTQSSKNEKNNIHMKTVWRCRNFVYSGTPIYWRSGEMKWGNWFVKSGFC